MGERHSFGSRALRRAQKLNPTWLSQEARVGVWATRICARRSMKRASHRAPPWELPLSTVNAG